MSRESVAEVGGLRRGRFLYFPVVPGRMEFAVEVRRMLLREQPQAVAIEIPFSLSMFFRRAVGRLPEMSVLLYPENPWAENPDQEEEERMIYLPVEPADPFVEAARTAEEIGA
ncbi:MAG: hypothetical protein K6T61_13415, partial [Bryobacteraceae bacterium]|nr:hypothetical protein [Bryobacteraceae bacterium]